MHQYLNKIHQGHCLDVLRQIPSESVQCVVTSPPYWGLRDYGTGQWEGGDPECKHIKTTLYGTASTLRSDGRKHTGPYEGEKGATISVTPYKAYCEKCGATRIDQQLGLESTPDCLGWATNQPCGSCYICKMVEVFREVRRVLRKDGTCWVNMGDGYNANTGAGFNGQKRQDDANRNTVMPRPSWLKPKDLCAIPWRLALALQADGWWLRQDIIWHKPNPMPESVTDRCTKAHEYLFLLTKSQRYYFDQEAIKEKSETEPHKPGNIALAGGKNDDGHIQDRMWAKNGNRNKRSVWTIPTQPTPEAHFATYPQKLVEPCILAGTSHKGACPKCGTPWVRVVEKGNLQALPGRSSSTHGSKGNSNQDNSWNDSNFKPGHNYETKTTGWTPQCSCNAGSPIPCVVLDPFMGAGTTAITARLLGRHFIGIELNPAYITIAQNRIKPTCAQLNAFHQTQRS